MRKMISFKIENLPEKERAIVDAWADGQGSIQQSLANIIMHVVSWSGNADVMDFEVQRKLHSIFANNEQTGQVQVSNVLDNESNAKEVAPVEESNSETTTTAGPLAKAKNMDWD